MQTATERHNYRRKPVVHMHVMINATGTVCNLDCGYCYYLSKAVDRSIG